MLVTVLDEKGGPAPLAANDAKGAMSRMNILGGEELLKEIVFMNNKIN